MKMRAHFLSAQERRNLQLSLKQEKVVRRAYRINTILLLDDGFSCEQIAKILFLDDNTVRHYGQIFFEKGFDRLLSDNYQGKTSHLSSSQENELYQYACSMIFRTVHPLILFVEENFGVTYSPSGMRDLLHRIGMTYKKASLVPGKADPEKQEAFIKNLEALMEAKIPETPVYFVDACHPTHNPTPAYGWIPKGKRAEVPANSGRERVNLNGAVNAQTHEAIVFDSERVNGQSTVALLRRIEEKHPESESIYVVLDNARYYHCEVVRNYEKASRIELVYLPAYSPNLNLIERLWKLMHTHVTDNRYYKKFEEFRRELLIFFDRLPDEFSESLSSLLTMNFHIASRKEDRVQAAFAS